jgi:hypothetical protein
MLSLGTIVGETLTWMHLKKFVSKPLPIVLTYRYRGHLGNLHELSFLDLLKIRFDKIFYNNLCVRKLHSHQHFYIG